MAAAFALRFSGSNGVRNAANLRCLVDLNNPKIIKHSFVHRVLYSSEVNNRKSDPKLSRKNQPTDIRNVTTDASYIASTGEAADRMPEKALDTTFNTAEEAYMSKKTSELLRALLVFKVTSLEPLVKHNMTVSSLSHTLKYLK